MSATVLVALAKFFVAYGPSAWQTITSLYAGVMRLKEGSKDGVPTDEQLDELVSKIQAQHDALPKPD